MEQEVELNWYRAGYRYWFLFDTDDQSPGDEFAIAPSVGAGLFDFTYKLEGPGDADVNRTYIKPMPQVGIEAEWKLSQRCSVVAGVLTSVPIPDTPFILSTRLAGKYRWITARSSSTPSSAWAMSACSTTKKKSRRRPTTSMSNWGRCCY